MNAADFERARNKEMARIRRSRPRYGYDARRKPAGVDWGFVRRRCLDITIAYVLIADAGLLMIAARGSRPLEMNFPAATVTAPASPHPATIGSHP